MRILVVDDTPAILDLLQEVFQDEGYEPLGAINGAEAWDMLAAFQPDVVMTDTRMPMLSGIELCRMMAVDPMYRTIPVILMGASTDQPSKDATPYTVYIKKPFELHHILETVASMIRSRTV